MNPFDGPYVIAEAAANLARPHLMMEEGDDPEITGLMVGHLPPAAADTRGGRPVITRPTSAPLATHNINKAKSREDRATTSTYDCRKREWFAWCYVRKDKDCVVHAEKALEFLQYISCRPVFKGINKLELVRANRRDRRRRRIQQEEDCLEDYPLDEEDEYDVLPLYEEDDEEEEEDDGATTSIYESRRLDIVAYWEDRVREEADEGEDGYIEPGHIDRTRKHWPILSHVRSGDDGGFIY